MTENDARKRWAAFAIWAERIPGNALKCRTNGHRWPDWEDRAAGVTAHRIAPAGVIMIRMPCERKCGAFKTQHIDRDGYLPRAGLVKVEYDAGYLMPPEARSGHGYTRDQRAYLRAERIERMRDWITEE